MRGAVIEFDDHRGVGVIRTADGSDHPFHCTQIADGSRTMAVGATVEFDVVAGHLGRWEASEIRLA